MTIKATIEIESGNSKGFICLLATVIKKNRSKKRSQKEKTLRATKLTFKRKKMASKIEQSTGDNRDNNKGR